MTTSPLQYQTQKAKTHLAAQVQRKRTQNAVMEKLEAEFKAMTTNPSETTRNCMRKSLYRFTRNPSGATPWDGTIKITAINRATGEIREYYTMYYANIAYIGNTDYLADNREPKTYYVNRYYNGEATEIDRRVTW